MPVNFRVNEGEKFFQCGPGGQLMNLVANRTAAVEVDVLDADGLEASGVLDAHRAHPTPNWNYVRITPESITGIRFRRS
ncbi:hypothetical protein [Rathayibacter soli]|uniref:hypothetical protein n=1 Tax=Rathayibacter soli TaxID=3144168 RepID=UPI0027E56D99|nr:hypothetical protein [Glaciibacter superstes]